MGNFFSTPTPIDEEGLTYKRLLQTRFYDQGSISVKKNGKWSSKMEDVFNFYSTPGQIQWFIKTNIQLYVDKKNLDEKRIAEDEATLTQEEKKWVDKWRDSNLNKNWVQIGIS